MFDKPAEDVEEGGRWAPLYDGMDEVDEEGVEVREGEVESIGPVLGDRCAPPGRDVEFLFPIVITYLWRSSENHSTIDASSSSSAVKAGYLKSMRSSSLECAIVGGDRYVYI